MPAGLRAIDQRLTQGRLTAWAAKQAHILWNDRHPIVMASHIHFHFPSTHFLSHVTCYLQLYEVGYLRLGHGELISTTALLHCFALSLGNYVHPSSMGPSWPSN